MALFVYLLKIKKILVNLFIWKDKNRAYTDGHIETSDEV
jgi:hypothetical protein